jgi:hypothetical protein
MWYKLVTWSKNHLVHANNLTINVLFLGELLHNGNRFLWKPCQTFEITKLIFLYVYSANHVTWPHYRSWFVWACHKGQSGSLITELCCLTRVQNSLKQHHLSWGSGWRSPSLPVVVLSYPNSFFSPGGFTLPPPRPQFRTKYMTWKMQAENALGFCKLHYFAFVVYCPAPWLHANGACGMRRRVLGY